MGLEELKSMGGSLKPHARQPSLCHSEVQFRAREFCHSIALRQNATAEVDRARLKAIETE